jgi:hypothetical protein
LPNAVVLITLFLMTMLTWRLGAFTEWSAHHQLQGFEAEVLKESDEADWEDRHRAFRRQHPKLGHNRPHMSLGRRK